MEKGTYKTQWRKLQNTIRESKRNLFVELCEESDINQLWLGANETRGPRVSNVLLKAVKKGRLWFLFTIHTCLIVRPFSYWKKPMLALLPKRNKPSGELSSYHLFTGVHVM